MYKLSLSSFTNEPCCVIRTSDGACIPINKDNTDYQAYLKWVSEGGVPLPADE
jgi:hypothetical protein